MNIACYRKYCCRGVRAVAKARNLLLWAFVVLRGVECGAGDGRWGDLGRAGWRQVCGQAAQR